MRRPGFVAGTWVPLANGQSWSLPAGEADGSDPEWDATFALVVEAEDRAERLRAELALTILLLSRNYVLGSSDYDALLGFAPDDPALGRLQAAVHALVLGRRRTDQRPLERDRRDDRPVLVPRPRWSLWSH